MELPVKKFRREDLYLLFFAIETLNEAIPSIKCSIMAPAK